MKIVAALFLTVFVVLTAGCSSSSGTVTTVAAPAFLEQAQQGAVTVIDVRSPEEFAEGHLKGAKNIDVEGPDFATQIAALDKSGTYLVYCRSGRRSTLAANQMAAAGFTTITNLSGGIADLQSAGASIVS